MKTTGKLLFALLSLLSLSFVFTSCGGDDEDTWVQKSVTVQNIDTLALTGLSSQTNGGSTSYTVTFEGHLSSDILDNLISTEFQNSDFGVGVFGLTDLATSTGTTVKISSLKVTVSSSTYTLGTCYSDGSGDLTPDAYESGDSYLSFCKAYFNAISSSSSQQATIAVTFITNTDILSTSNVSLRVKYSAKYTYKDYSAD